MGLRKCAHCKLEKPECLDNFYFRKTYNKWHSICKPCVSIYNKKYKEKNREKILKKKKEYYYSNLEIHKQKAKKWREQNKEHIRDKKRAWKKEYKSKNPQYRLKERLSCSIYLALKKRGADKSGKSIADYLPYTMADLKEHLQSQFEPWMNWDNWGVYDPKTWDDNDPSTWTWQIDHIIPQSKFKYKSMKSKDFKKCWSLENLRPLSSKLNITEQHLRNSV